MATDDGFTPVVDDEGWEIVVGAKKQGDYTYKVTYNPQGTTPIIREQGGTFVTDIPVASVTVEAPDEETAKKMAIASGAKGKLSVEKVVPTTQFLNIPNEERGNLLTESPAFTGGGTIFSPEGVAEVLPYSTASYLANQSVGQEPSFGTMAMSALRDIYSLPGRELVSEAPYIGTGTMGKTSEEYSNEGFGTNLIPAMIEDPANIPMVAAGGLMKLGQLGNYAREAFQTPFLTGLQQGTTITGKLAKPVSEVVNVARHTVPSAVTGGAYSAVGAGFNELTKEDQTLADGAIQVIGGMLVSGAIGGTGSKLSDAVYNIIAKKYPTLGSGGIGYIMSKLGLTQGGTSKNIDIGIAEKSKVASDIMSASPLAKEGVQGWDFKSTKLIPRLRTMAKDMRDKDMNLEQYNKTLANINGLENDLTSLEAGLKVVNPATGRIRMRDIAPERLLEYIKEYVAKEPWIGKVLMEEFAPVMTDIAKKEAKAITFALPKATPSRPVIIEMNSPEGIALADLQKRSAFAVNNLPRAIRDMTAGATYKANPMVTAPVSFDPTNFGNWLPSLTPERLNLGRNIITKLGEVSPTASGQYPQLMGLDTLKSSK